jgi:hypothetical protein
MDLVAGLKLGNNGMNIVNCVTLGPLGPAKPVDALSQLCTEWAIKVNDI